MWQQYQYKDATCDHPYFVYTPTTYHPGTAVPLLVLLHGCSQTAADFAAGTGMNELAERYGFIVIYPQQKRRVEGVNSGKSPGDSARNCPHRVGIAGKIGGVNCRLFRVAPGHDQYAEGRPYRFGHGQGCANDIVDFPQSEALITCTARDVHGHLDTACNRRA